MASLSDRGAHLADHSPLSEYMVTSRDHIDRRWSPDRPDGFIDMSTAENKLVWDLLEPEISRARAVPASAVGYGDTSGRPDFRSAIARLAGRTFLGRTLDPDSISTLAGAGAVLEAVFYALCDPGDGVLVPTPGYAGFWMDLEQRDQAVIVPVPTRGEDGFRMTRQDLDRAYEAADRPIRALLIASPDNPTGRVLGRAELLDLVEWCREKRIHLVSDEIYALSVYGGSPFTSVAAVTELEDDVHIVWAISKDFAVSGLRCGVLITENDRLRRAVTSQAVWSGVSGHTQHLYAELLADREWTDTYIREMRRRLGVAHEVTVSALENTRIAHWPAEAGFFVMIDLRAHLDGATFEAERDLWLRMVENGVNLTPGAACRSSEPGLFRLCFAATPIESIPLGVDRIAAVLG
ncbi:MAG: aminotransferase class I/II-fold pyridoxal phosphate-dependent enzyme [Acidimicrobiia bacterium]